MAVNIPMWNNEDSNELYILSEHHVVDEGICPICCKDTHVHQWGNWEDILIPTPEAPGQQQRSCLCGQTENRKVEGVWQKDALQEHLLQLPETVCCGLNLWSVLPHEELYYYNGLYWGSNASTAVQSITIPVCEGDRIFATSFGKAGENGHATSNGIRVTFFDAYGVCKTLTPAQTYAEFWENSWLETPTGAVAVNIPVYTDAQEIEVYLDRNHNYTSVITPSTCETEGFTAYTCTVCGGSYEADFTPALEHSFINYQYDPETCAKVAACAHGCGAVDRRVIHEEPQWEWSTDGLTGEDYGTGRALLALFNEHHQLLAADFCSSSEYATVGDTVIFCYAPPQFAQAVLEETAYIVRFSLELADTFAPILQARTFEQP